MILAINKKKRKIGVILTDKGMIEGRKIFLRFFSICYDPHRILLILIEKCLISGVKIVLLHTVGIINKAGVKISTKNSHFPHLLISTNVLNCILRYYMIENGFVGFVFGERLVLLLLLFLS